MNSNQNHPYYRDGFIHTKFGRTLSKLRLSVAFFPCCQGSTFMTIILCNLALPVSLHLTTRVDGNVSSARRLATTMKRFFLAICFRIPTAKSRIILCWMRVGGFTASRKYLPVHSVKIVKSFIFLE